MDFLRRIEDDVRNLGVESKRKHPEVREAAERALMTLRTMRESYVSEVMHGSSSEGSGSGGGEDGSGSRASPRIAKFRSAEVSAPYVLACGSAETEMPIKLVKLALNGIQILLNYEVVPPSEACNILRVLLVQSHSTSADVQLKVLQIVLQLANALAADAYANQYLTVENVREMLQLSIQLCKARSSINNASSNSGGFGSSYYSSILGGSAPSTLPPGAANIAVASTAFATVRQILALIMDATVDTMAAASQEGISPGNSQQLPVCAEMFLKDLSLFVRRKVGQWLVGVTFDFGSALDLVHEILSGWPELFVQHQIFRSLFQHTLCAALLPLLRSLPVDYVEAYKYQLLTSAGGGGDALGGSSNGGGSDTSPSSYVAGRDGSPAATVTKIARIARCILLQYPHGGEFLSTADSVASVMLQALQPDRENDLLLKTLPGNILDGTVTGGGTLLVDGSVSHSLVMLTDSVADHADQATIQPSHMKSNSHNSGGGTSSGISSGGISSSGGIGSSNTSSLTNSPSLISRLTSTSKLSQHTKEQIAYFSRATSGGIVLPLSTACNYNFNYMQSVLAGPRGATLGDGILALTSANVPKFSFIACHPAGVGLEAILAFLLTEDDLCVKLAVSEAGEASLVTVLTSVILSVTSTLTEALMIDANIRDFEIITKNSQIIPLVESILSQNNGLSWEDLKVPKGDLDGNMSQFDTVKAKQIRLASLRSLRDHLFSHGTSLTSGDVLLLGFLSLQIVCRHLAKSALLVSDLKRQMANDSGRQQSALKTPRAENSTTFFPASANGSVISSPLKPPGVSTTYSSDTLSENVLESLQRATVATFERTGNKLNDACTALLCRCNGEHFENNMNVTRRTLNMLAEAALSCGLLGLQRQGDTLVSTLCRFTVPRWHPHDFILGGTSSDTSRDSGFNRESLSRGEILGERDNGSGSSGNKVFSPLKRRHIQSFVRLTQVVHVLADAINDWDTIMDCFEQVAQFLITRHRLSHGHGQGPASGHEGAEQQDGDGLSLNDTEKIFQCIERFKGYTVFMSDETIVKLMTSLVALSVNSLSTTSNNFSESIQSSPSTAQSTGQSVPHSESGVKESTENNPISISMRNFLKRNISGPDYMLESLGSGHLNYSLHMAIEIVKINSFRVSCIWQMATSHLRILASHKYPRIRVMAVAATNDIITNTLEYMRNPSVDHSYTKKVVLLSPSSHVPGSKSSVKPTLVIPTTTAATWDDYYAFFFSHVTDSTLYEDVLPPYQTVFMGRNFQEFKLKAKSKMSSATGGVGGIASASSRRLQLTQADLLSSLRGLANIKHSDVRRDVMQGLLEMLEGGGQAVTGGWGIIIELLTAVPASMLPVDVDGDEHRDGQASPGVDNCDGHSPTPPTSQPIPWPVQALLTAFSCITLIVDDFLETLRSEDSSSLTDLVTCLSMFSRQSYDVNISLTSVQMLWKVTDFVMTASREKGDEHTTNAVLNVMLQQLLELSLDLRPEIRNCATNTLFSAIVSNAAMLSSSQWKNAFQEVIFPLFRRTESRSSDAMRSNEEALAPEIKKGVKMAVHHSRDTAHKQWSETRIFALRGLSRVVKICLRLVLVDEWFQDTWLQALDICIGAVQSDPLSGQGEVQQDLEVSLAGVDTVFDLLKMVSSSGSYKAKTRAAQGMRVVGGALVSDPTSNSSAPSTNMDSRPLTASRSSSDIEFIAKRELAQQQLWQLAWSAVKVASCFTTSGYDLPLHICKHLRELYVGGTEAEFRYSQNIQSMLEVLVMLSRPRVLVEVSGQVKNNLSACILTVAEHGLVQTSAGSRLGTMTSSQLHRAIMDMLKSVHPKDTVSFSCLVSCIAELCFHGQFYAQMPNMDLNHFHSPTHGPTSACNHRRRVVFGPVHASLREEVEGYMLAVLQGAPDLLPGSSTATSGCANPAKNKVVVVDPFFVPFRPASNPRNNVWFTTALHILSREFVTSNCLPASLSRLQMMFPGVDCATLPGSSIHTQNMPRSTTGPKDMGDKGMRNVEGDETHKRGSFLVSLAKMMSLSIEYEDDDQDGLPVTGRDSMEETELLRQSEGNGSNSTFKTDNSFNIQKDHTIGGGLGPNGSNPNSILKLMKLQVVYSSANANIIGGDEDNDNADDDDDDGENRRVTDGTWGRFHLSKSSLQLMAAVMNAGLPALHSSGMPNAQAQLILRNCLFISACCVSPWSHARELHKTGFELPPSATDSSSSFSAFPVIDDILILSSSPVENSIGEEIALAESVSVILSSLAIHMQIVAQHRHSDTSAVALGSDLAPGPSKSGQEVEIRNEESLSDTPSLVQAWVRLLVLSSQLICWALVDMQQHSSAKIKVDKKLSAELATGSDVSPLEKSAPFSYFIKMLQQTHKHLFELMGDENNKGPVDVALRTMALSGAYEALASLVDLSTPHEFYLYDDKSTAASRIHQRELYIPSPQIHDVCATSLRNFCILSTTVDMIPSRPLPSTPASLQVALGRWVQGVRGLSNIANEAILQLSPRQSTLLAQIAPTTHSPTVSKSSSVRYTATSGSSPSGSGGIRDLKATPRDEGISSTEVVVTKDQDESSLLHNGSGHIFLFSEMASRLVYSNHPFLRATAMRALRASDSSALLIAYKASLCKIKHLEAKNTRLTDELAGIKSAASFQF